MLVHLLYVSTRTKVCTDDQIQNILSSCKKNNSPLLITGLLLYSDTTFVQYVEGDPKLLLALYDKIKEDERHENVRLISLGVIQGRIFPNWYMGNKKMSLTDIDYITDMTVDDKAKVEDILTGNTTHTVKVQEILKAVI